MWAASGTPAGFFEQQSITVTGQMKLARRRVMSPRNPALERSGITARIVCRTGSGGQRMPSAARSVSIRRYPYVLSEASKKRGRTLPAAHLHQRQGIRQRGLGIDEFIFRPLPWFLCDNQAAAFWKRAPGPQLPALPLELLEPRLLRSRQPCFGGG
ncbi:hypothetical protein ACFQ36_22100 [Arthrobacter sp. GCM10027362]|uniref:hypothetical protein n=1 Tax=Arthrobacter sp. GCM10027362 TaxID=3273379 RepID=UPI003644DC91